MDFGIFILAQQRGYHQTSQQVINNSIEQTVAAEQAGFGNAWYAEHHFNNYSLSPSPLMMVAHMAAKTTRIRLGTAVCILPLYQPARFLAEVGFVDTVSNGRLDLGVGSGYQEFEFERFGVKIADATAIYNEFLDILPKGLTQKIFEYEDVRLSFDAEALEAIAQLALDRKIGARGLRLIMEELMLDLMYQLPSTSGVKECLISKEVVLNKVNPLTLLEKAG